MSMAQSLAAKLQAEGCFRCAPHLSNSRTWAKESDTTGLWHSPDGGWGTKSIAETCLLKPLFGTGTLSFPPTSSSYRTSKEVKRPSPLLMIQTRTVFLGRRKDWRKRRRAHAFWTATRSVAEVAPPCHIDASPLFPRKTSQKDCPLAQCLEAQML